MPRVARILVPGGLYHVISRFTDSRFELDGDLRLRTLEVMDHVFRKSDWTLLQYGLMTTHLHWSVLGGESPSSDWTRPLNCGIARAIQASRRRTGTALGAVFGDRPKELLVDPKAAGRLFAYIANNPVRAGVVSSAEQSDWTSHRAMIGKERCHSVNVERALFLAGFATDDAGRKAYHEFVVAQAAVASFAPVDVARVRTAARVAGGPTVEIGGPRLDADTVYYDLLSLAPDERASHLVECTLRRLGTPDAVIRSRTRVAPAVFARRVALLAARDAQIPIAQVAACLGISRSSASELVRGTDPNDRAQFEAKAIARSWRKRGAES